MKRGKLIAALVAFVSVVAYGATTFTTNYNLNKPGDRDRNYGSLIRDNFDTIDTQMKTNETSISNHLIDAVDAHDASAISTTVGAFICTSATDVQAFLDCLDGTFDPATSGVVLIAGAQTVTGLKTFSQTPIFPSSPSGILNTDSGGVISASSFAALDPLTTKGDLLVFGADSTRIAVGTDGQQIYADSAQTEGIAWGDPNPRWRKFTLTNTDFSAAATTFSVVAVTLASNEGIDAVVVHHTTAFSGGAVSAYTVEVGQSGNNDQYANKFDVFQATGNAVRDVNNVMDVPKLGATTAITATAVSTGANLDQASAGSVDVYIRTFLLP